MTSEDYEKEYHAYLSRVRSFLASPTRSLTTLKECDRLLTHARRCADAIISLQSQSSKTAANLFSIEDWKRKAEQDIAALRMEVDRSFRAKENQAILPLSFTDSNRKTSYSGYRPPTLHPNMTQEDYEYGGESDEQTMETQRLIQSSEAMLLESKKLCVQSEEMGNESLLALMRQREQLQGSSDYANITRVHLMRARILLREL